MNSREAYAAFFVILFLLIVCSLLLRIPARPEAPPAAAEFVGAVLWKDRTFEVVLQGFIILAGVVSILLLLVSGNQDGDAS